LNVNWPSATLLWPDAKPKGTLPHILQPCSGMKWATLWTVAPEAPPFVFCKYAHMFARHTICSPSLYHLFGSMLLRWFVICMALSSSGTAKHSPLPRQLIPRALVPVSSTRKAARVELISCISARRSFDNGGVAHEAMSRSMLRCLQSSSESSPRCWQRD